MQTFLPYADFYKSMQTLDPSRLGNQVYRECKTLINGGWANHPVAKMWKGYEHALAKYALAGLEELTRRGKHYQHHIDFFNECLNKFPDTGNPSWLGNELFHLSHRANLYVKDPVYYSHFQQDHFRWEQIREEQNIPDKYYWPTKPYFRGE